MDSEVSTESSGGTPEQPVLFTQIEPLQPLEIINGEESCLQPVEDFTLAQRIVHEESHACEERPSLCSQSVGKLQPMEGIHTGMRSQ